MARDEEAEVAGQYKVHVSGTIYELTGEKFYDLFREFLFIVILMYPNAEFNTHARYPR
jgi:hypothetical protein